MYTGMNHAVTNHLRNLLKVAYSQWGFTAERYFTKLIFLKCDINLTAKISHIFRRWSITLTMSSHSEIRSCTLIRNVA